MCVCVCVCVCQRFSMEKKKHALLQYQIFKNKSSFVLENIDIVTKYASFFLLEHRGAYDKFPDFFRMGTFIDSTSMKL